jgi:hypothetical protein
MQQRLSAWSPVMTPLSTSAASRRARARARVQNGDS